MFSPDDNMLAFGSCLAGFGILVTGLLALLFRNPDAPRWTRPELVAMLVCVPLTAMIGLGLGYTAYGVFRLVDGTGDPRELLVLATVLIVLALAWSRAGYPTPAEGQRCRHRRHLAPARTWRPSPPFAVDEERPPSPGPRARSSGTAA